MANVKEFRYGPAIIRVHGEVNKERIERAIINFLKKVEKKRRSASKNGDKNTSRDLKKK